MKKTVTILNAVLIVATMTGCICYHELGGTFLKGLTSSGFVLIGVVNLIYAVKAKVKNLPFPILMATGLLLSMIGDVALNIHFITGALFFAVGHLFYFAAYCCLMKFKATDILPSVVIFAASTMLITLAPIFDFGSLQIELVCIVYALVISCMVGKAISNLIRERNTVNSILVIGSALFYFSDLMLVFSQFGGAPDIADTLCLFTYFPAQCLLAHSVYRFTNKKT